MRFAQDCGVCRAFGSVRAPSWVAAWVRERPCHHAAYPQKLAPALPCHSSQCCHWRLEDHREHSVQASCPGDACRRPTTCSLACRPGQSSPAAQAPGSSGETRLQATSRCWQAAPISQPALGQTAHCRSALSPAQFVVYLSGLGFGCSPGGSDCRPNTPFSCAQHACVPQLACGLYKVVTWLPVSHLLLPAHLKPDQPLPGPADLPRWRTA